MTEFSDSLVSGSIVLNQFVKRYLGNNQYVLSYGCCKGWDIDCEFLGGKVEIKTLSYDDAIVIEEDQNFNETLGPKRSGWYYKSESCFIYFHSEKYRKTIRLSFTPEFKKWYEEHKESYNRIPNKISTRGSCMWQSAFRKIPIKDIKQFLKCADFDSKNKTNDVL